MLVLTRKLNESIIIGRDGQVVIKVLEIKSRHVRIGVAAPTQLMVHREEVFLRIQQEAESDMETHDAELTGVGWLNNGAGV